MMDSPSSRTTLFARYFILYYFYKAKRKDKKLEDHSQLVFLPNYFFPKGSSVFDS